MLPSELQDITCPYPGDDVMEEILNDRKQRAQKKRDELKQKKDKEEEEDENDDEEEDDENDEDADEIIYVFCGAAFFFVFRFAKIWEKFLFCFFLENKFLKKKVVELVGRIVLIWPVLNISNKTT